MQVNINQIRKSYKINVNTQYKILISKYNFWIFASRQTGNFYQIAVSTINNLVTA